MKTCSKCKIEKEFSEFHKHKSSKDGYRTICKECRKPIDKLYYKEANVLDKVRERRKTNKSYLQHNKKYKENNKEFVNKLKKEWNKSETCKKSKKKYYEENADVIKKRVKENREKKKEKFRESAKLRRSKPTYKERMSDYIKKHRKKNPHVYAWRTLLYNTLKRLNTKKSDKTIEILGYSADDLKIHLESLFKEGMTWENYGDWHIDHIKPVSKFDEYSDIKEINSLKNLQPLWAEENLSKSNKYN